MRVGWNRERTVIASVLGVLAAATLAIVAYNLAHSDSPEDTIFVPKATKLTPEAELLQAYIRIDTTNPPGNETAGARFLAERLRRAGLEPVIVESAPGRGNVYARIRGRKPGDGLLLLSHIDVVPASGKWTRPPFSGGVALNMIHGRGAIDMKSIAICQLEAFSEVARSGRTPEHDIAMLAVADEEEGGELGTKWLLTHRPDFFEGMRYVLNEGGITEMQREKMSYFGIETGSKQLVDLDVVFATLEQARAARIALEPYFDPPDPDRVLPGVRNYFASVAPTRIGYARELADIDRTIAAGKFWSLAEMYRYLLCNNVRAYGPQQVGAGRVIMRVNLFDLPDENPDARLAWLAKVIQPFGGRIDTIRQKQGPSPISDDATILFAIIRMEAGRQYPGVPSGPFVLPMATNDSRFLRARGLTCYGVQPFRTDFFQSLSIHHENERIRVDWFTEGVAVMKRIVTDYAFGVH